MILDSYEKYIDQYAKLYKKAQVSDMSAMTEYASMPEKANDLSSKLDNAKSEMSVAQIIDFFGNINIAPIKQYSKSLLLAIYKVLSRLYLIKRI